jgi:hypothetical protein
MAAGNLITWDMVHYDVQIIGGITFFMKEKYLKWLPVKEKL